MLHPDRVRLSENRPDTYVQAEVYVFDLVCVNNNTTSNMRRLRLSMSSYTHVLVQIKNTSLRVRPE